MKVVVYNLGCKVNQYESDSIMQSLSEIGYDVSDRLEYSDAYVLNTCAVTAEAERKSRQAVTRCRKFNPNAIVIVCGCASQNDFKQFESKDGVTYISGVAGKNKIAEMLLEKGIFVEELPMTYEDNFHPKAIRTRAYVKIQDGCNNFCAYCLIPFLRGRSRSRTVQRVVSECKELAMVGVKEIVLTGINLSAYGLDLGTNLPSLLRALSNIDVRIRLGSLEVNVIDEDLLLATQAIKKFCPQFHLSLQSGCNRTLKAMNRHYTVEEYYAKVTLIRQFYRDAAITTDLICGYPTESAADFADTLRFIDKTEFSDMHIFAYSKRQGTAAAKLAELPHDIIKTRCTEAEKICAKNKVEYLKRFIGKRLEVLVEDDNCGYSTEYIRVYTDGVASEIAEVTPKQIYKDGLK